MGSKILIAAPLWAERYRNEPACFHQCTVPMKKLKSCIIKVLMFICPTTPHTHHFIGLLDKTLRVFGKEIVFSLCL